MLLKIIMRNNFVRNIFTANRSISTFKNEKESVILTDDGSTFVCWHPEKSFPYEYSKPMIRTKVVSNSILKIENIEDAHHIFKGKSDEQVREELTKITYTCKHRWFPCNRRFKRRTSEPVRRYL